MLRDTALPRLGLQAVAEHIAFLIKMRKLQTGGQQRYRRAISRWEHDLAKLKQVYYGGNAPFPWPGTEP